jgi:hypothetical protein
MSCLTVYVGVGLPGGSDLGVVDVDRPRETGLVDTMTRNPDPY